MDKEMKQSKRDLWLSEFGKVEKDVLTENGTEFIMVEPEQMDEGENESAEFKKVELPEELQSSNVNF